MLTNVAAPDRLGERRVARVVAYRLILVISLASEVGSGATGRGYCNLTILTWHILNGIDVPSR